MASYNLFNYNYRPAKSTERKILIELLKEIYGVGAAASNVSYVGMGSIFFADFKLIHKEIGINKMVNIEYNVADQRRFEYNKPYFTIDLQWGMTTDVLPQLDWNEKKIIWLDYDQSLQNYMFEDTEIIFSQLVPDSFVFISCNSSFNKFYSNVGNVHDVSKFRNEFGNYTPFHIDPVMLTNAQSPFLIRTMFHNTIKHVLDSRNAVLERDDKLVFIQLLFITYKDGAPMFSLGGILKKMSDVKRFSKSPVLSLPYIRTGAKLMDIESPLLTNSEIDLMNSQLPQTRARFLRSQTLNFIPETEKEKYHNIYRYYPSFVEIKDF